MSMNDANVQEQVADEVSRRLAKATQELGEKYAAGKGGMDDNSVDGPTGAAYRERARVEAERQKQKKQAEKAARENKANAGNRSFFDEDEDPDDIDEDTNDPDLMALREKRLKQMKSAQNQKLENLGKGHGQYRYITQDEFIKEMTVSDIVVCHFYHKDFPKCEIMHHHLQKLAYRHIESKFVKIDAEKALFFVDKLTIRSLPTVVIFFDGVAKDKIIGFDGLADDMPEGKEDEWPTIKLARLLGAKGAINNAKIVDDDGVEAEALQRLEQMRKNMLTNSHNLDLDMDDDLELSD